MNLHFIVVLLLLLHFRDCSCNNADPCSDPSNQRVRVPFRTVDTISSSLQTPIFQGAELDDSTNCYWIELEDLAIHQEENSRRLPATQVDFRGRLSNRCDNGLQLFRAPLQASETTNDLLLSFPSPLTGSLHMNSLSLQGFVSNGTYSWALNITTDSALFSPNNTKPPNTGRLDDLFQLNPPCSVRSRSDGFYRNTLYSPDFRFYVQIEDGTSLTFTFPAGVRSAGGQNRINFYYQNCECIEQP